MLVKQVNVKSHLELFLFIFTSLVLLLLSKSLLFDVLSFLVLVTGSMYVVRFNLAHPYTWYTGFFSLYALGYPILLIFESANPVHNYGYSKELIVLHWIALVTFLLVVNPKVKNLRTIKKSFKGFNNQLNKYVFYILSIAMFLFSIYLMLQGFNSKSDIGNSNSFIVFLGMRLALVYILVAAIELINAISKTGKINYFYASTTIFLLVLIFYYSAERDLLLRYLLILFYIYYIFIYNSKHKLKLIIIITTLFLSVPISRSLKFLGMRGETSTLNSNIIVDFINSEFHTQARNVQLILNNKVYEGYFEGQSFLSVIPKLFGLSDFSIVSWFQNTFYASSPTGMGFSLVGEGYLNGGYLGVIIQFFIIGIILNELYKRSDRNIYYLAIYLLIIPISVYVNRADLYNFISQLTKQVLLVVLILVIVEKLVNRKNKVSKVPKLNIIKEEKKYENY